MTSLLEQRYRRVLNLLPASYREKWADDMTTTFMDRAYRSQPDDPEGVDISKPRWSEVASILGLAVRLRLGAEPGYAAWGEAVRRIALIGLFAHTVVALTGVVLAVWSVQRLPGLPAPAEDFTSRWHALWSMSGLLFLPAYLAVLHGHGRAARVLTAVAYLPVLADALLELHGDHGLNAASQLSWLAFDALPLIALVAVQSGAPPVRPRPWLVALPVGVLALAGIDMAIVRHPDQYLLASAVAGGTGLWCIAVTVAGLAALTPAGRASNWPLTLALLAPPVLALHTVSLLAAIDLGAPMTEAMVPGFAGVMLLAVGAVLTVIVTQRMRAESP